MRAKFPGAMVNIAHFLRKKLTPAMAAGSVRTMNCQLRLALVKAENARSRAGHFHLERRCQRPG
jgi:hypothetical protein